MSAVEFYDSMADHYDEIDGNLWPAENAVVTTLLHQWRCARGRVLDLGCGTGLFLDMIMKARPDYLGIDASGQMLKRAREKHPHHHFVHLDIADLTAERAFDSAVCLFGVFSYVLNLTRGLHAIHRALRPGGRVFMMLYGRRYHCRPSYVANREGVSLPTMLYSPHLAAHVLREAGFEGVRTFGMTSRLADPHLTWMNPARLASYLWWEVNTIGRRWPSLCWFTVAVAQRPVNPIRLTPDTPLAWPRDGGARLAPYFNHP